MYTILVTNSNELVTTVKERIMQRSKLVDNLHFLVDPKYKDVDMTDFAVTLEYVLPVSREYKTENLVKADALYKEMLEYRLPFDTNLTKEAGKIEIQLTFTKASLDADGNAVQQVRKTSAATINIIPITAWSDVIADNALTALDQRLIMVDAMINQLNDMHEHLDETKADNVIFDEETHTLQLTANGKAIGDKVVINNTCEGIIALVIDGDGNLVAVYADGREETVGKTGGTCAGVYIPEFDNNGGILKFTLKDNAEQEQYEFDIRDSDNWHEISSPATSSNYAWEEL